MSVPAGIVAGSVISTVFNLFDRVSSRKLFVSTGLLPMALDSLAPALVLHFLTGLFPAGIYSVGIMR
jgi:hypothetical protein